MYLHINHDGITSPCTLDWPREVEIGNASKQSALEIWNGKKLKDLQIAQLEGKRNEIPFCKDCSAPMVLAKKEEWYELLKITHRIKPSFDVFEMNDILNNIKAIEKLARKKNLEGSLNICIKELKGKFDEICISLQMELEKM